MWAGQLIDLGGRNTLLYYRDLKVGTLDLTGANPDALSALLEGKTVRLSRLVADVNLQEAGRRCRTVAAKARENFEERGLSTLYIARGLATWSTESGATATPSAPIFLAQVALKPVSAMEADFELVLIDEWEPNPTLLHTLKSVFKISVDPDALVELMDADSELETAFAMLEDQAQGVAGFAIASRTVIGNFSYVKQPMVVDLETAIDTMLENNVIAALSGDRGAIASMRAGAIDVGTDEPDRTPPANEFLVLDADASQHFVINAALRGAHLVIQGPPGTGKSQTIANLIASLSGHSKSVLFVAEKRAAIDAVVSRLAKVGLKDLVLDLHGGGSSRKKMAQELRVVYEGNATVRPVSRMQEDARLIECRSRLNRHAAALHSRREPWACSVYELQSRLIGLPDDLRVQVRLPKGALHQLNSEKLSSIKEMLSEWISLGGPTVEHRLTPWSRAADSISTNADAQSALTATRVLYEQTLPDSTQKLERVLRTCGLRRPQTVEAWADVLELLHNVSEIEAKADPTIWTLDLHSVLTSIQPSADSVLRRAAAALFDSEYRRAKKLVRELMSDPPAGREFYNFVHRARGVLDRWASLRNDNGLPRLPVNLNGTTGAYRQLTHELAALGAFFGSGSLTNFDTPETEQSLEALLDDSDTLFRLPTLNRLAHLIDRAGFAKIRQLVTARSLGVFEAQQLVEYVFCMSALEEISLEDNEIATFDGDRHSQFVAEFQAVDREHVQHGAARVRRAAAETLLSVRNNNPDGDSVIRHEVKKQRRHRTLRELTQIAPDILLALKPCWAMSPLAVSQLLDARKIFDVVIFDEASQVPPADAVPAIMRASQVIVAGDSKQLPPTAFFASTTLDDQSSDATESDSDAFTEGMESILDAMANIVTAGAVSLDWHYRSRDERLIAFSNAQPTLYNWQMQTFPGAAAHDALRHVYVPWHPGGAMNEESSSAEVKRVVELIAGHARMNPQWSLGVIAMGIKHADRIAEALRRARGQDSVLNDFCEMHPSEPIFVKNLERVQGDEREAIILSVGYGKSADGRMLYRFGPINNSGGERRLNVAVTRARSQMTVVSSFLPTELDPSKLRSEGAKMLARYLTYAASEGSDLGGVQREHPELNHFEMDIRDRLTAAGIPLEEQKGVSGYYLDFAARHPDRPGEYVLAIEADGARYHSSPTARERDRLRQTHLENLGWRFHRIWSTDWFKNREREIAKALSAWQAACALADQDQVSMHLRQPDDFLDSSTGDSESELNHTGPTAVRSARRPKIQSALPIDQYSTRELNEIVKWVASDGLLRTDAELLDEVVREMGYQRRGSKIVSRVERAIAAYRKR